MSEVIQTESQQLRALLDVVEQHAALSLTRSGSNAPYVEETRRRLVDAQALILSQTGEVEGLMACWISEIRPAAEILFGDLTNRDIGSTKDYTPTLFVGVYARTRIMSIDEIFGPTVSLDLIAQDQLPV